MSPSRGTLRVLLVLTSLGLVGLGAGPASAERLALEDPAGDVWSPDQGGPTDEGSVTNADVVGTTVGHRARSVVVRTRYAALELVEGELTQDISLRTPAGRRTLHVWIDTSGDGTSVVTGRRCASARVAVDVAAGRVVVGVPRSCLGRPAWVRLRLRNEWYVEETGLYVDDATAVGSEDPVWSPRVGHA